MPSFRKRTYQKELLDGDDISFADIRRNMQELDFINRRLGGHDITLDGIVALIKDNAIFNKRLRIVEIGCGGGDNLRAIKEWATHIKLPVALTGIDYNAECIAFAQEQKRNEGILFIHSDYRLVKLAPRPDIVFSSLFCHHFTDEELVQQLKWMAGNSEVGFFINDLHRHPLAYYSIRFLTALFSKSYLVRNDAPLSVRRGFSRKDWERIFSAAQISGYRCQWRWAFRWLLTCESHGAFS
ncbi:methyltransferase domain-containing protein [Flavisolibacter nicotianae]|uniref:methyltransferase domain-containing protein n=1 Tax=Flavisolibacter nicotianae TaxID=2364882 RepID=UPI000EB4F2CF|nr:methyltransferase domain-containing protein [Flavisolibacter nicotianae]